MQRWTDQEIVDYVHEEKKIDIARTTVNAIKNQVEAEGWYFELRESGAKYIAIYKERLDSLLSYQKKLHEIINRSREQSPELVLRAISELHRIELSLHTLLKELPGDIGTSESEDKPKEEKVEGDHLTFEEWVSNNIHPRIRQIVTVVQLLYKLEKTGTRVRKQMYP